MKRWFAAGVGLLLLAVGGCGDVMERPEAPLEPTVMSQADAVPARHPALPAVQEPPAPTLERTAYEVKLTFEPDRNRLTGESIVTAMNRSDAATDELLFHLYLNAFDNVHRVRGADPVLPEFRARAYPPGSEGGRLDVLELTVDGRSASYEVRGTLLRVTLDGAWAPGEQVRVRLKWAADIPRIHHRVGQEGDAYWFGNVLPILAVYDGAWRENAYEAVGDPFTSEVSDYAVEVTAPTRYRVSASGEETERPAGDLLVTRIHAPRVRDFAFAISAEHRTMTTATERGVMVNLLHRSSSDAQLEQKLGRAVEMLEYMEGRVGAYPYGELDMFENEMFITGMEYPGILFVRSDRLRSEEGVETVVHEVAHQWFYNVVGNDQVAEPWLDEGFATYLTDAFMLGDDLDATYQTYRKALRQDVEMGDVRGFTKWSDYWRANYRKSALMLHALREELGAEGFDRFLSSYYGENQYRLVTGREFQEAAERAAGRSLEAFFEAWIP
jgi:hypothetical protein